MDEAFACCACTRVPSVDQIVGSCPNKAIRTLTKCVGRIEALRPRLRNLAGGCPELCLQGPQTAHVDSGPGVFARPRTLQLDLECRLHTKTKRTDLPVQRLPREFRVMIVKWKDFGVEPLFEEVAALGLDADRMHRQFKTQV